MVQYHTIIQDQIICYQQYHTASSIVHCCLLHVVMMEEINSSLTRKLLFLNNNNNTSINNNINTTTTTTIASKRLSGTKISQDALQTAGELIRQFVIETRHRASIEVSTVALAVIKNKLVLPSDFLDLIKTLHMKNIHRQSLKTKSIVGTRRNGNG